MKVKDAEIDDASQGSGIQSLLMFETLSLIDRDYFQKFGWRQAAIWAVEEPESSLHSSWKREWQITLVVLRVTRKTGSKFSARRTPILFFSIRTRQFLRQ